MDQVEQGAGGPSRPGKPGGLGGPATEGTLDYAAQQPGGPYSKYGPGWRGIGKGGPGILRCAR